MSDQNSNNEEKNSSVPRTESKATTKLDAAVDDMPDYIWLNPTSLTSEVRRERARVFLNRQFEDDVEYVRADRLRAIHAAADEFYAALALARGDVPERDAETTTQG